MSRDYALESFIDREENRLLDEELSRFDSEEEEAPIPPYYIVDGVTKETATGRVLTDEEAEDISEAWSKNLTFEQVRDAERNMMYEVITGKLK